mgnify:CR=1 FL=1
MSCVPVEAVESISAVVGTGNKRVEREIDRLVYELHGLTEEEIGVMCIRWQ